MKRRYYRVKKVYPKQKWLPVNNEIVVQGVNGLPTSNYMLRYEVITQNPTRNNADASGNISSATIIKCGRFKYKGLIYTNALTSYIVGISYIPEGYTLTGNQSFSINQIGETFFYKHPEWVIAWTRLDYVNTSQNNEIRLSSKLKRNLNSGDGIIFFVIGINNSTSETAVFSPVKGTVSYVCRTN